MSWRPRARGRGALPALRHSLCFPARSSVASLRVLVVLLTRTASFCCLAIALLGRRLRVVSALAGIIPRVLPCVAELPGWGFSRVCSACSRLVGSQLRFPCGSIVAADVRSAGCCAESSCCCCFVGSGLYSCTSPGLLWVLILAGYRSVVRLCSLSIECVLVCVSLHRSLLVCLTVYLSVLNFVSVYLSVSICVSVYLSVLVCVSVYRSVLALCFCLYVCFRSVFLCICLYWS